MTNLINSKTAIWEHMRAAMNSEPARAYAAKQQAAFEQHKHMLRFAMTMKQTIGQGFWTLVDAVWEFTDKRVTHNANDRNAVMQINRLKLNLQINWTHELVLTKKQKPTLRAAFLGGYQVWSCLRHDRTGATAIMLFHRDENKYMIVYEDGTFTRSFGTPKLSAEVWPTVAPMSRNTAKARKLADKIASKSTRDATGAVVINRYSQAK